jgi:hypothetical protein
MKSMRKVACPHYPFLFCNYIPNHCKHKNQKYLILNPSIFFKVKEILLKQDYCGIIEGLINSYNFWGEST